MAQAPADTTHFIKRGGNWIFAPKQSTFLNSYWKMTNAELADKFGASESTIEFFTKDLKDKNILPLHKKIRADDLAAYKEELQNLKKWAKNPTFANWAKYFGKSAVGEATTIGVNIRAYFTGEPVPEASKRIMDSLEFRKEIPKNAQDVLKTFTKDFFKKNRPMLGGTPSTVLRTPLQKGTNDYTEIIKIFNKYKDDVNISKLAKQDQILRLMKNNPTIIERFKAAGVPLTFKNLRTRIARTHNAIIRNSIEPKYYDVFKGLSLADRQKFLNMAI